MCEKVSMSSHVQLPGGGGGSGEAGGREREIARHFRCALLSVCLSLSLSVCLSVSLSLSLCPGGFPAINVRKMQPIRVSGCPSVNPT